jgi:hypothetical protein
MNHSHRGAQYDTAAAAAAAAAAANNISYSEGVTHFSTVAPLAQRLCCGLKAASPIAVCLFVCLCRSHTLLGTRLPEARSSTHVQNSEF